MANTTTSKRHLGAGIPQNDPQQRLTATQFQYQIVYILARLEAMVPDQRIEALRRIGVFDEEGKRIDRGQPSSIEPPADIVSMTPEEQISALTAKMLTAMDAGMSDANAQMVGRVLDWLEKKAKEEALKTNIVLNFCPWLVPDDVADRLFDTAFDGITIDSMLVKADEWRTMPEEQLIAQALLKRSQWAKLPLQEYLRKVMDAIPAD